jgi:hypothetical protein
MFAFTTGCRAPEGAAPKGTASEGTAPEGTAPEGTVPSPDLVLSLPKAGKSALAAAERLEDGSRIDVLFTYTTSALKSTGGLAGFEAKTYANEAFINIALRESLPGVRPAPRVNVVGIAEIPDSTPLGTWNQAQNPAIKALRAQFRADLVVVVHHRYTSGAGIATVFCDNPEEHSKDGYVAQIQAGSMMYYMAPAHEIGHLLGAGHDYAHRGVVCLYGDSRGWSFEAVDGTGNKVRYGTLMDYKGDVRIPRFSNPDVTYLGVATGKRGSADNARAVDSARATIANYVATLMPIAPAPGGPALTMESPANGTRMRAGEWLTITARILDSDGVREAQLLWDTGRALDCSGPGTAEWSCERDQERYRWRIRVGAGERAFRVRAVDSKGNRAVTEQVTVLAQ